MSLATQLGHLERSDLIQLAEVQPELEYLFRHTLIKDAAYGSMMRASLRQLHRLVGETLENRYLSQAAPPTGEIYFTLGHHFSKAGDRARALRYFMLAGDSAAAVYANAEAAQRYALALAAGPPADLDEEVLVQLVTKMGRALELSGNYPAALEAYAGLEAEGRRRDQRAMIVIALSQSAIIYAVPSSQYDGDRAEDLLEQALPLAVQLGDRPAEARLLWIRMLLELSRSRPPEALQAGEVALKIAREVDLREQIAQTLTDLGRAYLFMGDIQNSRIALDEARELWRELGNRPMLAESLTNAAMGHFASGQLQAAAALTAESHRISRSIGNAWGQAYSLMIGSQVAAEQGHLQTAIDGMEESVRLSGEAGFLAPSIEMRAGLAFVYAMLGFMERAAANVDAALASAQTAGFTDLGGVLAIRAFVELRRGDRAAAEMHLAAARESLSSQDAYSFSPVFVAMISSEAALVFEDYQQALAITSAALDGQRQAGIRAFPYDFGYLKARALSALGHLEEADRALIDLSNEAEQHQALRMLWSIQALRADLAEQRGRLDDAYSLRQSASANIDIIAARFTSPVLRDAFLGLPEVRALLAADGSIP